MAVEISKPGNEAPSEPIRPTAAAMLRGARLRCPACGQKTLFARYLKVADQCSNCKIELHHHRADDAPPYFTILIVGHVIVAGVLALEQFAAPEPWVQVMIWMPLTLLASLMVLPRIKGALVGLQWALRMHGFGDGPDPAQPDRIDTASSSS